jgi:hypothetical protein
MMYVWLKERWYGNTQTCHGLLVRHEGNAERVDGDVDGARKYRQNDALPGGGWHKRTNEDTGQCYAA